MGSGQRAVGGGSTTGAARRPNRSLTSFARPAFGFFVAALLLFPIFAHGCHRGDHDDEPAFVPVRTDQQPPDRAPVSH